MPVERPAATLSFPKDSRGSDSKLEHQRRRGESGKMQSDPKLRTFTSLCHEISAAQQRETEQQLLDPYERREDQPPPALATLLQPSHWPVDVNPGGLGLGLTPPWLDARIRALVAPKIERPLDVALKKSFPVSSGDEHSVVCVTPLAIVFIIVLALCMDSLKKLKKQNQLDLRSFVIFLFVMSIALYCVLITVLYSLSRIFVQYSVIYCIQYFHNSIFSENGRSDL